MRLRANKPNERFHRLSQIGGARARRRECNGGNTASNSRRRYLAKSSELRITSSDFCPVPTPVPSPLLPTAPLAAQRALPPRGHSAAPSEPFPAAFPLFWRRLRAVLDRSQRLSRFGQCSSTRLMNRMPPASSVASWKSFRAISLSPITKFAGPKMPASGTGLVALVRTLDCTCLRYLPRDSGHRAAVCRPSSPNRGRSLPVGLPLIQSKMALHDKSGKSSIRTGGAWSNSTTAVQC